MKKKLLPICAMALLTVGYSSVASADTGTVTKEEAAQVQQDKAKKEEAIKAQQKNEEEKKQAAQVQEKSDMAKKEAAIKEQQKNEVRKKEEAQVKQKNDAAKKEVAKPIVKGEKLPNTASNNVAMMGLSACLVAVGTLFGLNRRNKVKA
ncbi:MULTISPECIES: LPXTG cell wall anchor domain-containing protein [Bacillus cereus group]|uniref:LPXTG cell wall anchor domain-containing protein n=1 Tax=Bacillus cereus group TaxID=86661 RepID=UPI000BFB19B6|nr:MULTISPECIES: LPXTG cell wall anchor domain-containing protein [Bacillus cereus group]MBJ8076767.1 LPXTG cell wall anchor domain-containing protein [Bacillus cereus group sp. N12]MBJ8098597.1 LPXTG cell wall anchor domain-containing protein [Bacillus cereus group sp. N11]MDM5256726.1 LPXTG cell wall anchor domain-containing protein [Bacillus toyonensis]PHD52191.1 cell surface protein [Bacillus toyonensis]HDR7222791.1 LPXTG cell wall anchor domain-containing protein [Bacillus toyonensis]